MNFHWPFFHKPEPAFVTDLRERLVETETQLVLLRDLINRKPRRLREVRSDAKSYLEAKRAMTDRLTDELQCQSNQTLSEAIEDIRGRVG